MRLSTSIFRIKSKSCLSRSSKRSISTSSALLQRQIYHFGRGDASNLSGDGYIENMDPTAVKAPPKDWRLVSSGWLQNFAITESGEVFCWGKNEHGQLGMPYRRVVRSPINNVYQTQQSVSEPEQNMSFAKVKLRRVAAGRCHTLFQTADGILLSCGNNEVGQLGVGIEAEEFRDTPQVIEVLRGKQIVDFSAGLDHSIAISREGKVYAWGFGPDGQLGMGDEENRPAPTEVPALQGIVSVGCGLDHSIVLDSFGGFWAFGRNDLGQLGIGSPEEIMPRPVRSEVAGVKFVKVACGGVHSVALSSTGVIYTWGGGASGRLGHGSEENKESPTPVQYFMDKNIKIVNFAVGGGHTLALSEDGRLYGWGFGQSGRLGLGDELDRQHPVPIPFFDNQRIVSFACGLDHSLVVSEPKK